MDRVQQLLRPDRAGLGEFELQLPLLHAEDRRRRMAVDAHLGFLGDVNPPERELLHPRRRRLQFLVVRLHQRDHVLRLGLEPRDQRLVVHRLDHRQRQLRELRHRCLDAERAFLEPRRGVLRERARVALRPDAGLASAAHHRRHAGHVVEHLLDLFEAFPHALGQLRIERLLLGLRTRIDEEAPRHVHRRVFVAGDRGRAGEQARRLLLPAQQPSDAVPARVHLHLEAADVADLRAAPEITVQLVRIEHHERLHPVQRVVLAKGRGQAAHRVLRVVHRRKGVADHLAAGHEDVAHHLERRPVVGRRVLDPQFVEPDQLRHDLRVERGLRAAEPVDDAAVAGHRRRVAGLLERVEAAEDDLLQRVGTIGAFVWAPTLASLGDVLHQRADIAERSEGVGELRRRVVGGVDERRLAVEFVHVGAQHAQELGLDQVGREPVILPVELDRRRSLDQPPLGGALGLFVDAGLGQHLVQLGRRDPAHRALRQVAAAVELDAVVQFQRREQHRGERFDVRERFWVGGRIAVLVAGQIEVAVEGTALDALLDVGSASADQFGRPRADLLARNEHGPDDSRAA